MEFEYTKRRMSQWMVYAYHGIHPRDKDPIDVWEYRGSYRDGNVICDILMVRAADGEVLKFQARSHGNSQVDQAAVARNLSNYLRSAEGVVLRMPIDAIAGEAKALPAGQSPLTASSAGQGLALVSRIKRLLGR